MNNIKKIITVLIFTSLSAGCSQISTRANRPNSEMAAGATAKSVDDFGDNTTTESVPTLAPTPQEEKRVAVILGPGGYKSFAHAGVLKELKKKNIPINKIVGLEWGALVAGLYAQRGQVNEAEWKLYKLEKLDLNTTGFFSRKKEPQDLKVLEEFLRTNLDLKDVTRATVPFFCPSLSLSQGAIVWQESGLLYKAVQNCLAYPPLFNSQQPIVAALFSLEDVIIRLKHEGFNTIVLVNVLGDGNLFDNPMLKEDYATAILWNEARRSLWQAKTKVTDVIEVNTRGVHLSDFESRKLLVTAGEAAGEKAARDLASKYGF